MKHILITTFAGLLLVGTSFADPIHDATKEGDLAGVQAELDNGVNINATGGSPRGTAMHHAVTNGHLKVVELLLAKEQA